MEAFVDVVRVAVVMGGESTHRRPAIKTKARIHLDLDLRSTHIEPGGRSRACLQGFFPAGLLRVRLIWLKGARGMGRRLLSPPRFAAVPGRSSLRPTGRGSSRCRPPRAWPPR